MIKEVQNNDSALNQFLIDNNIDKPITSPFSRDVVYVEDGEIIGFLNYAIMYEKAEINYIYVVDKFRNQGIGAKLLTFALEKCKICENVTLEVRKDNIYALKLYKRFGFKEVAVRENYYNDVDGVLMMREGE